MRRPVVERARRIAARIKHTMLRRVGLEYLGGVLHELLTVNGTDLVIDVGANAGQYAKLIRGIGYSGELVSVEPVTELSAQIKELAAWDRAWTIHNLALGSSDRQAHINVTNTKELSSLLEASDLGAEMFGERIRVCRRQAVTVRRLDRLIMGTIPNWSNRTIHLKIDTQGSDLDVLGGSEAILGVVRTIQVELPFRKIYSEAHGTTDLTEYLTSKGFALHAIFPVVRDSHGRLIEADGVFVAA